MFFWTWEWLRHWETQSRGDWWCNTWHKRSIRGMQPGWCANLSINTLLIFGFSLEEVSCLTLEAGWSIYIRVCRSWTCLSSRPMPSRYCSVSTANNFWLLGWRFFFFFSVFAISLIDCAVLSLYRDELYANQTCIQRSMLWYCCQWIKYIVGVYGVHTPGSVAHQIEEPYAS